MKRVEMTLGLSLKPNDLTSIPKGAKLIVFDSFGGIELCTYNSKEEWFEPEYAGSAIVLSTVVAWAVVNPLSTLRDIRNLSKEQSK